MSADRRLRRARGGLTRPRRADFVRIDLAREANCLSVRVRRIVSGADDEDGRSQRGNTKRPRNTPCPRIGKRPRGSSE